jgi:iron complex transport system substrate-binding protein
MSRNSPFLLILLTLLLAACGGAQPGTEPAPEPAGAPAVSNAGTPTKEPAGEVEEEEEPAPPGASDAFPVTIDHAFGEVTLESAPERIVSIGYADQDVLFALGTNPVAVRYWFGAEENGGIFPWAEEAFTGDELPDVLNMTFGALNYEAILSYDPDLIVAVSSGITEDEYDRLAQIAPTLAQSGEYNNFGMPWDEAALMIGEAVGKSEEAAAIVAGVRAQFDEALTNHPEFVGKDLVVATGRGTGGYAIFSTQDAGPRFFQNLGFAPQTDLDELTGESFYAELSEERVTLLDRDVIVFTQASYLPEGADSITNDPLLGQLDALQDERYIILSEELDAAFSFSSVLSLPYAIEQLVPQLAEVLGDATASSD